MDPKKIKKRKRKRIRTRDWESSPDADFTHERRRFRGSEAGVTAGTPDSAPDYFRDNIEPNAIVVSPYGALVFVQRDGAEILCRVSEFLMRGKTSVLAPGDAVRVEEQSGEPFVVAARTRRTKLSRPAIEAEREQVFAANIDMLIIVVAARKPAIKLGLIDRFLIAARAGGVEPMLCVNKMDLVDEPPPETLVYNGMLPVFHTCAISGAGVRELREALRGKLSVVAGHSGVGKSSLINALAPGLGLDTSEVSAATGKGRHTTAASRLYTIGDIRIIDTPGIRQLGVWGVSPAEIAYYFPEFAQAAAQCRFRDCTHAHEPGCAVLAALEAGTISRQRYGSYLRIRQSIEDKPKPR